MFKSFVISILLIMTLEAEELILNLKASDPQKLSLEFGLQDDYVVSIEPGISGTKFHLGYGVLKARVGAVWGHRFTLTYLYMNETNRGFQVDQNYMGIEALGMFMFGIGNLGLFYDVESGEARVSIGVGIGI